MDSETLVDLEAWGLLLLLIVAPIVAIYLVRQSRPDLRHAGLEQQVLTRPDVPSPLDYQGDCAVEEYIYGQRLTLRYSDHWVTWVYVVFGGLWIMNWCFAFRAPFEVVKVIAVFAIAGAAVLLKQVLSRDTFRAVFDARHGITLSQRGSEDVFPSSHFRALRIIGRSAGFRLCLVDRDGKAIPLSTEHPKTTLPSPSQFLFGRPLGWGPRVLQQNIEWNFLTAAALARAIHDVSGLPAEVYVARWTSYDYWDTPPGPADGGAQAGTGVSGGGAGTRITPSGWTAASAGVDLTDRFAAWRETR